MTLRWPFDSLDQKVDFGAGWLRRMGARRSRLFVDARQISGGRLSTI
jgi:hypothetical protein